MSQKGCPESPEKLREHIATVLASRTRHVVPDVQTEARAAVALILRPEPSQGTSLLLIQRADQIGDPWSGHMALPGGRWSPQDPDLQATAARETREETSLVLREEEFLGALDDVHPAARDLPSIAVTPFAVWYAGNSQVRGNEEIRDHVWVTLEALRSPDLRSTLTLSREERTVVFPTIEYRDYTIWGLTFEILSNFLNLVETISRPAPTG